MAIKNSKPMPFTPRGLCDAFDATAKFTGACRSLVNLVFDQGNPELMLPRPGVQQLYSLAALGITGAGYVSIQVTIGTRIYGLVASSLNAGHDQPFVLDTTTGLLVAISGITSGNTPTSPATTGDWTPPTVCSMGGLLIFTHPGFTGAGTNFFGVLNITNPAAPTWTSGNTSTNPLTGVPTAVANFNNRAYFTVGNQTEFTDVLSTNRTNASQALTIGDASNLVAVTGQPVQTTSSGVVSALLCWKNSQIWAVTGDPATGDLALNFLTLTIGTNSPRSIAQAPSGIYFLSQVGGPYVVDALGMVRALTHDLQAPDPDVQVPFQNATSPSRWAGAYIASIYRVCGPTVLQGQAQVTDYWFDEHRRRWNGPHSFAYDCASGFGSVFVLSSVNNPGLLLSSTPNATAISTYTDLGTAITCLVLSSTWPKVGDMLTKQVVESQVELGGPATYTITALNETGVALVDPVALTVSGSAVPLWGGFIWGDGTLWTSGNAGAPQTYAVPWNAPLVFEKLALQISVAASSSVQIGAFFARYQRTGYMTIKSGA